MHKRTCAYTAELPEPETEDDSFPAGSVMKLPMWRWICPLRRPGAAVWGFDYYEGDQKLADIMINHTVAVPPNSPVLWLK